MSISQKVTNSMNSTGGFYCGGKPVLDVFNGWETTVFESWADIKYGGFNTCFDSSLFMHNFPVTLNSEGTESFSR